MALGDGIRRDVQLITQEERDRLREAFIKLDTTRIFPDGVSYWDKQEDIHKNAHAGGADVHGGPAFLPWHREICNRLEAMLREVDADLSLHYWDWTKDPRSTAGGRANLFTPQFMGSANGDAGPPLENFTSTEPGHSHIWRNLIAGAPVIAPDNDIITAGDSLPPEEQYNAMDAALQGAHNYAHSSYIRGTIGDAHFSFHDPFVFLLHSNVDRLWAMWQTQAGREWRLDPNQVYGVSGGSASINDRVEPWAGNAARPLLALRPWAPPENQQVIKTYKDISLVAPPCYDTLPTVVRLVEAENPGGVIRFNDVPTGETAARAASFRVFSCGGATFVVTSGPSAPYFVLTPGGAATVTHGASLYQEARIWFGFTGGAANTSAPAGTVTIHCNETNQDFVCTLQANSIAPPTVGVVLTLDQSGSMAEPAGTLGATRLEVLKEAARHFVNLTQPNNGVGLVRFDHQSYGPGEAPFPGLAITPIGGWSFNDPGRVTARNAVNTHNTNPNGWTSVGAGIQEAKGVAAAGFDHKALLVLTDGLENTPPTIISQIDAADNRIYAVGLGTEGQVNTYALRQIANNSGGYLLLTGLLGSHPDDEFLLSKFFFQILAGVTNTSIVRDPTGYIAPGVKLRIPFLLNEADIDARVIALTDLPGVLKFAVETPQGDLLKPTNAAALGATFSNGADMLFYHFGLPVAFGAGQHAGTWHAVLEVDGPKFRRYLEGLRQQDQRLFARASAHGVHYSVNVHSWSNVRMKTRLDQTGQLPGATIFVRAALSEYGIPLAHRAAVRAELTRPDGTMTTLAMGETEPGIFTAAVTGYTPGVYRFRVIAEGATMRGRPFTREELVTGAITSSEIVTTVPGDVHEEWCRLLNCLLRKDVLGSWLKRNEIDADAMRKCVKLLCQPRREGRPR